MADDKDRNPNPPDTDTDDSEDNMQPFNFTTTGDDTAWDSGRGSSITRGSQVERDLRSADAETPGVSKKTDTE